MGDWVVWSMPPLAIFGALWGGETIRAINIGLQAAAISFRPQVTHLMALPPFYVPEFPASSHIFLLSLIWQSIVIKKGGLFIYKKLEFFCFSLPTN